jgi:hypothetical protein
MGKFESFVEMFCEIFVFEVNQKNLPSDRIPDVLRIHHTQSKMVKLSQHFDRSEYEEAAKLLTQVGQIWATSNKFGGLSIPSKLSFGKHGEHELVKLFRPIGINDVFEVVEVWTLDEDAATRTKVDFRGVFNSVTYMRNNILHEDATPTLTHRSIAEQKGIFVQFSESLVEELDRRLSLL